MNINIEEAKNKFGVVLSEQLSRVEKLKKEDDWIDYSTLDTIIIGMVGLILRVPMYQCVKNWIYLPMFVQ